MNKMYALEPQTEQHMEQKRTETEEAPPRREHRPQRKRRRHWPWVLLAVVLVAAVCAGLFCWQKWGRFDDAADIQGEWKVVATGDTIVLDARSLKLTQSISYDYRLDTQEKTIAYSFASYEGGGHYYFNADRDTLVILEGGETWGLLAQLGFLPEEALAADSATDEMTVLRKVSDDTSVQPSSRANGLSGGSASTGEREYVMKPEPSSSSSSGSGSTSNSGTSTQGSQGGLASGSSSQAVDSPSGAEGGGNADAAGQDAGYGSGEETYNEEGAYAEEPGYADDSGGYAENAYGADGADDADGNGYDESSGPYNDDSARARDDGPAYAG